MKHTIIKYIILVSFSGCYWSCKKELNVLPTTSVVDGNVIVDAKSAATVLNGVYYRFANGGTDAYSVPTIDWLDVQEMMGSRLAFTLDIIGGGDAFSRYNLNAKEGFIAFKWNNDYALVNAANGFIKNIGGAANLTVAARKQMLAEVKFLRAFGDADLLFYYGQYNDLNSKNGIILHDEFVTSGTTSGPRATVAACYAAILADLDAAIPDLPVQNTQTYYANSTAAKILKARVLISRGSAGDYGQVISLMDEVINAGTFSLEPHVKDLFLVKGPASSEVVMSVQPFPNENYKFTNYNGFPYYVISDTLQKMLINDARRTWVYKDYVDVYEGNTHEFTKYYSGDIATPMQTPLSEQCYAFRLTEAYLLEAEAITLSGGDLSKAKSLLITVLAHADNTDFTAVNQAGTADNLRLLIVEEGMKNFVGENGSDWLPLRRLPFATVQKFRPGLKAQTQLILPIPDAEIIANNQIVQNPGY